MIPWLLLVALLLPPCNTPPVEAYAFEKAERLSSTGLVHSTATELAEWGIPGWYMRGENLCVGPSVEVCMEAWEGSPTHAAILYGNWTSACLGTHHDGTVLYVVLIAELRYRPPTIMPYQHTRNIPIKRSVLRWEIQ